MGGEGKGKGKGMIIKGEVLNRYIAYMLFVMDRPLVQFRNT